MSIKEIYRLSILELKKEGIKRPELDAQILICFVFNVTREDFYIDTNREVSPAEIKKINLLIQKRSKNIPVAYLTGHKEFFGFDFKVDKKVLIPRPESERLVELAIEFLKKNNRSFSTAQDDTEKILDLGTGSGNIIISILLSLRAPSGMQRSNLSIISSFFASDISSKALSVAKKNARYHKVDQKITFIKSNLFSNPKLKQKFDLIIANLPYVPVSDCHSGLDPESRSPMSDSIRLEDDIFYEPKNAIFASDNGADIIKRFLADAPHYLNDNGTILIELDPRNAEDIKKFSQLCFPQAKIKLEKDLAGFHRYLIVSS